MKTKALSGLAVACLLASVNPYLGGRAAFAQTTMMNGKQLSIADLAQLPLLTPGAGDGDYRLAPPYANAPELTPRSDVPKGTVYRFRMNSTDSKLYPGIAKDKPGQVVPYSRGVNVYVPSQYVPGTPAPFLVSQDSMGNGSLPTILDNMIADHRLPVMVAMMINSGGGDSMAASAAWSTTRSPGKYAEFIETEVLPKITQDYHITFSKDPNARMTMGGSSGGACAFTMAWYHPEWYHRVLTYSGTYVNQQTGFDPASPHGAWEYHEHFIMQEKPKPLRIWLHVGENDNRSHDEESTYHNWVMANQRMATALKAKKYHYQFVFAQQSGHVDGRVVNQTLPAALEYVWKGYPIKTPKAPKEAKTTR